MGMDAGKFRGAIFGGFRRQDVLDYLEKLHEEHRSALEAQRTWQEAVMTETLAGRDREIAQLREQTAALTRQLELRQQEQVPTPPEHCEPIPVQEERGAVPPEPKEEKTERQEPEPEKIYEITLPDRKRRDPARGGVRDSTLRNRGQEEKSATGQRKKPGGGSRPVGKPRKAEGMSDRPPFSQTKKRGAEKIQ